MWTPELEFGIPMAPKATPTHQGKPWHRIVEALTLAACIVPLSFRTVSESAQTADKKPADKQKAATTPRWTEFQKTVQPFFAKHCTTCHSAKGIESDAPFDMFQDDASLDKSMALLEKALDMLERPEDAAEKTDAADQEELEPVLAWLKTYTNAVDCQGSRNPGRVTIRRLNRAEYNNTIRDLLAIEFRPADNFPLDDAGYGFDNIADVLSLSPLLVEKYLDAASFVLDKAIFAQPVLPPPTKAWDAAIVEGTIPKGDPKAGIEASGKVGKATAWAGFSRTTARFTLSLSFLPAVITRFVCGPTARPGPTRHGRRRPSFSTAKNCNRSTSAKISGTPPIMPASPSPSPRANTRSASPCLTAPIPRGTRRTARNSA